MMSSGFPSVGSFEASSCDGGEDRFGVDFRRFGTGDGSSTTLMSERRLLTPFVERALRLGSIWKSEYYSATVRKEVEEEGGERVAERS